MKKINTFYKSILCLSLLLFYGLGQAQDVITCNSDIFISLSNDGTADIFPDMILEGDTDPETVEISRDQINYYPFVTVNCDDLDDVVVVSLRNQDGNVCWSEVTVEDKLDPVINSIEDFTTFLVDGVATIDISDVTTDVYDNCTIDTSFVDPSEFTAAGSYYIIAFAYDQSGNLELDTFEITVLENPTLTCNEFNTVALTVGGSTVVYAETLIQQASLFDNVLVSLDNVNFDSSISFDCEDVGEEVDVFVTAEYEGDTYTCSSTVTVVDNLFPVAICTADFTIDLEDENDEITISAEDIDNGSFDNCNLASLSISQETFTADDHGVNLVELTVVDDYGNFVSCVTEVTVLIDGQYPEVNCIDLTWAMPPFGSEAIVWASDFISDGDFLDEVLMSTSENGPFSPEMTFGCDDILEDGLDIYIQYTVDGNTSTCSSKLFLQDNVPPVVVVETSVILVLEGGTATLTVEAADDGTYDNCGLESLTLSQSVFTTADLGENLITFTAYDINGNFNSAVLTVVVIGNNDCDFPEVVNWPENINLYGTSINPIVPNDLEPINLVTNFGYALDEVTANVPAVCNNIYFSFSDQVIINSNGYKVLRTWTGLDWLTAEVATHVQIIQIFNDFNSLTCTESITLEVAGSGIQLYPEDVVVGYYGDLDDLSLEILDEDNNVVPDNFVSAAYIGQTLTSILTHSWDNNSCFSNIIVTEGEGCAIDLINDVDYPDTTIVILENVPDVTDLSPEVLEGEYGFDATQVQVIVDIPCSIIGVQYEDVVFDLGADQFKIVRTFTVIDWYSDPFNMETFVQEILIGLNSDDFICDFLPRTAPVGDCDSGHTLEDDVEWPADLSIADYRLSPEQLIVHSSVDPLDAEPSFYNQPTNYEATYTDILVELTPTTISLARIWNVVHVENGLDWTYSQAIEIDISDFENLVIVNTLEGRPMPNVVINNDSNTNLEGKTTIDTEVSTLQLNDDRLNGINIVDLLKLQRHILSIESLSEDMEIAGDISEDESLTALDLQMLSAHILGAENNNLDWNFQLAQVPSSALAQPAYFYEAYKLGDVDDSAVLGVFDDMVITSGFQLEDILLNAGETYQIPIYPTEEIALFGGELRIKLDTEILDLIDVEAASQNNLLEYHLAPDGTLTILFGTANNPLDYQLSSETPLSTITVYANENSLLSLATEVNTAPSYYAGDQLQLITINGEINNEIVLNNEETQLTDITTYPNPAFDFITIEKNGIVIAENTLSKIYDTNGRLLLTTTGSTIDVSQLDAGIFIIHIQNEDRTTINKFIKM